MKKLFQTVQNQPPNSDCPQDVELESYVLNSFYGLAQNQRIAEHIAHCSVCQDKMAQMRDFYDILNIELSHPVPPEVIHLKNKIQKH